MDAPRPAATVIPARQAAEGVELLVEQRSSASRFAAGFVVFPGGVVDAGDEALASRWFGDPAEAPRACAVRELFEETGLLLTRDGLRLDRAAPTEDWDDPPRSGDLVEIARWVAPEFLKVRFDAPFYGIAAPPGIEPVADGVEIERAWWAQPSDVLAASERGEAPLMWPTLSMLNALSRCRSVDEVLASRVAQVHPPSLGTLPDGYRGTWRVPESEVR